MEKKILNMVKLHKVLFYNTWFVYLFLFVASETGLLDLSMRVEPKSQTEYVLQVVCIAGVLLLPFVFKLFNLNTTKNLKRMNNDEALANYNTWYIVRIAVIEVVAVLSIVCYMLSSNMSCGILSLMAMVFLFFCYPTVQKVKDYLDIINEEEKW